MSSPRVWHDFQIGKDVLPEACCICLKDLSDLEEWELQRLEFNLSASQREITVWRCERCIRKGRPRYWKIWFASFLAALPVGFIPLCLFKVKQPEFSILFALYALLALGIAAFVAYNLTGPLHIKQISGGKMKLLFPNPKYRPVRRR